MKKVIVAVIIVVGIALAFFAFRPKEKEVVKYDSFEVKKGDIRNTITATGTIEPITQVEVGTQVSGTIAHIYVDYNTEVKKGQLIAELDKTVLESEYESQLSAFYSNQNEYDYQKKNHERVAGQESGERLGFRNLRVPVRESSSGVGSLPFGFVESENELELLHDLFSD